jgi:metal transporter CNNM
MTPAPAPGGGTDDPVFGALNATACTLCVAAWDAAAAAAAEAAPGDVAFEIFRWVAIVILVCMSGLFSGLTLGLLGLDLMGLEIVIKGSKDPVERANARKIYEVRKQGNLLLCTLLLGNVAVNSALAILSSEVFSGLGGFFASTFTIVIFGEILPQATCARYALAIGARTVWIVQIFKYLLFVITWPIAKLLDIMLGEEAATFHSQGEMSVMLQNYVKEGAMAQDEVDMMTGALAYKDKTAADVMTPVSSMFTLSINNKLDFKSLSDIFKSGFSRIPVLGADQNDVVGMILTKDLIMIDPEDGHTVMAAMQLFGRNVHQVYPNMKLPDVLQDFKSGSGHLAVVMDVNNEDEARDPFYEVQGLVTLEDIIEEILQAEIVDETDNFVHIEQQDKVRRASFDLARLRMLSSGRSGTARLSQDEARAVAAHLMTNVGTFREAIKQWRKKKKDEEGAAAAVVAVAGGGGDSKASAETAEEKSAAAAPSGIDVELGELKGEELASAPVLRIIAKSEVLDLVSKDEWLYRRDTPCAFFTLVLSGKLEVFSGRDKGEFMFLLCRVCVDACVVFLSVLLLFLQWCRAI